MTRLLTGLIFQITLTQGMTINYGSSVVVTRLYEGRPFQADYETVEQRPGEPPQIQKGRLIVDSSLRTRAEIALANPGTGLQRIAWVHDPIKGIARVIDAVTGSVISDLPSEPTNGLQARGGFVSGQPAEWIANLGTTWKALGVSWESLGDRPIETLPCRGFRVTRAGAQTAEEGFVAELWISIDLGQVVLEEKVGSARRSSFRLSNIKLGEPDPSLFDTPR